jgi:hypothetical protein
MKVVLESNTGTTIANSKRGDVFLPEFPDRWTAAKVESNLMLITGEVENREDGAYRMCVRIHNGDIVFVHYATKIQIVGTELHVKV